jgi:hypothetical protein
MQLILLWVVLPFKGRVTAWKTFCLHIGAPLSYQVIRIPEFNSLYGTIPAGILLLCITFQPYAVQADMDSEIDHLLQYIEISGCTFHRNGNIHNSQDASEHIQKKYAHTKRWIKTSEDFILYAATKSSVSGQLYHVTCDGIKLITSEWLAEELARFRK